MNKNVKYCTKCGTPINFDSNFCANCGNKIKPVITDQVKQTDDISISNQNSENIAKNETSVNVDSKKYSIRIFLLLVIIAVMYFLRNSLSGLYILLILLTVIWTALGILNPKLALFWKKKEIANRGRVIIRGVLIIILLITLVVTSSTPSTPVTNNKTNKSNNGNFKKVVKPTLNEQIISIDNGIKVTLPPGAVNSEMQFSVNNTNITPKTDDIITNVLQSYEINLGDKHEFDGDIIVEIPFDYDKLKGDPYKTLEAVYYNEETDNWEQLRCKVNDNILEIYMDHLTVVAIVESNRKKVRQFSSYELNNDLLKEIEKIGNANKELASKKLELIGWSQTLNYYGFMGSSTTFMEEVLDFSKLSGANNIMKYLGATTAIIQVAAEVHDGKYDAASQTGIKGFLSYSIAQWGTKALNVAGIAMFAIDYSLTTLGNEAVKLRKDMLDNIYMEYYSNEAKRTPTQWYNILWDKVTQAKSQEDMKNTFEKELDDYVSLIWKDEGAVAALQAELQGHGWTFEAGFSEKQKRKLEHEHKILLIKELQPVINTIQKNLNSKIIKEKVITKMKAINYLESNFPIRVSMVGGYPKDKVKAELWDDNKKVSESKISTITDPYTSWEVNTFDIKKIDYIKVGMPKIVKLVIIDKDGKKKVQSKEITIGKDMYGTRAHVNFEFECPKIPDDTETLNDNDNINNENLEDNSYAMNNLTTDNSELNNKLDEIYKAIAIFNNTYNKYSNKNTKESVDKMQSAYTSMYNIAQKYIQVSDNNGNFTDDYYFDGEGIWIPTYDYNIVEELYKYYYNLYDNANNTQSLEDNNNSNEINADNDYPENVEYNSNDSSDNTNSNDSSNYKPNNEIEEVLLKYRKAKQLMESLPPGKERDLAEKEMRIYYKKYLELAKTQ